jgi:hypothetical protein
MEDQLDVAACRRVTMRIPIRLGTKRKMFSFVCSSSTRTGCLGVPLLWLMTRLSAAILAEVVLGGIECDVHAERMAPSIDQEAVAQAGY